MTLHSSTQNQGQQSRGAGRGCAGDTRSPSHRSPAQGVGGDAGTGDVLRFCKARSSAKACATQGPSCHLTAQPGGKGTRAGGSAERPVAASSVAGRLLWLPSGASVLHLLGRGLKGASSVHPNASRLSHTLHHCGMTSTRGREATFQARSATTTPCQAGTKLPQLPSCIALDCSCQLVQTALGGEREETSREQGRKEPRREQEGKKPCGEQKMQLRKFKLRPKCKICAGKRESGC